LKVKNNNGHYIQNHDLYNEIVKFKENGVASETLGEYLLLIANNLSSKGRFNGYTWRNDMVSEAVLTCIKYLRGYDTERTNAFAYVTQICKNAMFAYIKTEHKHSVIKDKCYKLSDSLINITNENKDDESIIAINYMDIGEKRKRRKTKNLPTVT
jgi:DNA-directed RNA polymerase specialized sigma24 family protein